MAREVWRRVPSYPYIEASSHGRVRCVPTKFDLPNGGWRISGGEATVGQWDRTRYLYRVRGITHKVARLVCEAFKGPAKPGQVCMHIDENSRNNHPSNLRWGTQKENLNAPGFLAYCRSRTGERNPRVIAMRRAAA